LRIASLAAGRVTAIDTRHKATKKDANLLTAQHLMQWMFVDLWVIPTWPTCLYVLLRIIMWYREGRFAAMLPSADGIWRRNHNKSGPGWFVDVDALVVHLFSLHTGGRWPDGSAPIVLVATQEHHLKDVKKRLVERGMDPDECARLRAVPFTLSQKMAIEDFNLKAFMDAPHLVKWGSRVLLVKRGRVTLSSA